MTSPATLAYVQAAAALLALPLSEERAHAVAEHFERTAAMARLLEQAAALGAHDEPAAIYCPAPFPAKDC
ncbi:DUF4089 domain-containing protein [Lampropedia puyangensis]|uniref:DUF4089 domain-containing protein n=1 Tax=Lampropedia puyangensis TaxID=1330072 RepID=A0A4S8EWW2_9BURK|nr:AtzG-like protein [Lampropedia puyangensis]THT99008.1 DUF4089 domain-containing protein [Lampropedia puyangensis]